MRILIITDLFPVDNFDDNTPRTLYDFASCWKRFGHEVKVIRPNFLFNSFIRKKKFYKTGWYNDVYNVNYILPFWGRIQNKLKKYYDIGFEPDVVISHMPSGNIFANRLDFKNFNVGIHCSDVQVLTNPLYSFCFKSELTKAIFNSEKIFCRSFVLKNKLERLFPELSDKIYAAPSGINPKIIVQNIETEINPKCLKICTCANLIKRKNIDKLLVATKNFSNIVVTVIGDGVEFGKLKQINSNAIFTGRLEPDEVFRVMRQNDIFILPSENETFGMVYLEAMANGCIPVCAKDDAIDGIIEDGINGFTVDPTVEAISDLILKLFDYDCTKLNEIRLKSLETVKKYDIETCAKNYIEQLIQK